MENNNERMLDKTIMPGEKYIAKWIGSASCSGGRKSSRLLTRTTTASFLKMIGFTAVRNTDGIYVSKNQKRFARSPEFTRRSLAGSNAE